MISLTSHSGASVFTSVQEKKHTKLSIIMIGCFDVGEVLLSALPARLLMDDTQAWTVKGVTLFQPKEWAVMAPGQIVDLLPTP